MTAISGNLDSRQWQLLAELLMGEIHWWKILCYTDDCRSNYMKSFWRSVVEMETCCHPKHITNITLFCIIRPKTSSSISIENQKGNTIATAHFLCVEPIFQICGPKPGREDVHVSNLALQLTPPRRPLQQHHLTSMIMVTSKSPERPSTLLSTTSRSTTCILDFEIRQLASHV